MNLKPLHGLAALVFALPLVYWADLYEVFFAAKTAVLQVGLLLVALWWAWTGFREGKLSVRWHAAFLPASVFLIWTGISHLWSLYPFGGFQQWSHWTACSLALFLAVQLVETKHDAVLLLRAMVASVVVVSVIGIVQYLFEVQWIPQAAAPAATFGNRNVAAHVLVLGFPIAVYFLESSKERAAFILSVIALSLIVVYLSYTFTKAAWLAVFCECGLLFGFWWFAARGATGPLFARGFDRLALGVAVIAVVLASNLGPHGWRWRGAEVATAAKGMMNWRDAYTFEGTEGDLEARSGRSVSIRLTIWRNALELVKMRPLTGVGVGAFGSCYLEGARRGVPDFTLTLNRQPFRAHNDLLHITAELGLIGVGLIVWLGTVLFRSVWRNFRSAGHDRDSMLLIGICGIAIAGCVINSCFCFPALRAVPPFYIAVLAAIACASYAGKAQISKGTLFAVGRAGQGALVVIFAVLLAATVFWQWKALRSELAYRRMTRALIAQNWDELLSEGERVRQLTPGNHLAAGYMARAWLSRLKPTETEPLLKEARSAFPFQAQFRYYQAKLFEQQGRWGDAVAEYQELLKVLPDETLLQQSLKAATRQRGRGR